MDDFRGKTVLVTGGSRGLGEAFCHKFAELGCRVFVNYAHGREAAEQVAAAEEEAKKTLAALRSRAIFPTRNRSKRYSRKSAE